MSRDAEATRGRLLRAATAEFATHGIAGARVDRIAAAASANKNLIYVYFGNKERLLDAVYGAAIAELLDTVPFDAEDLPGYAGRLFDFYLAHPDLIRLARWHGLERTGGPRPLLATGATGQKLKELSAAQAAGTVDAGLPPADLLTLVLTVAATWSDGALERVSIEDDPSWIAARRHAVVVAVARLIRPPTPTPPWLPARS